MKRLSLLCAVVLAACHPSDAKTFKYSIDPKVAHVADLNGRPVEAVADSDGRTSLFIVDELILNTSDPAEAQAVATELGGTVLRNDAVPEAPAALGFTVDPALKQPTQFTLHFDPAQADLSRFVPDMEKAGLSGTSIISSEKGAQALALITHLRVEGHHVSPNFIGTPAGLTTTQEAPNGAGFLDAFTMTPYLETGARSNVTKAWQFIDASGGFTRVGVAVIDDGFWIDPDGKPLSSTLPWSSDLPAMPIEYDFPRDEARVGGPNRNHCTGGGVCNWHGNGSVGTAVGLLNNQYGGAGTGGQVGDPMLFATEISWDHVARAIRTAVAWHASVISMSFGGECDNVFCDGYGEFNIYPALRNARDNKVIAIASAGNDHLDTHSVPCKGDGVICVGALADNGNLAIDYSNFGQFLDIWAPTDITVMPDGDSTPAPGFHNGTSASAPFVAGVAAMMKAYDSSLTSDQINQIFQDTGWSSPDPKVHKSINAYAALRRVTGSVHSKPVLTLTVPDHPLANRTMVAVATASDFEDGDPCCTITWDGPYASVSGDGRATTWIFGEEGSWRLTAHATNRHGVTTTADVIFETYNAEPVLTLNHPVEADLVYAGQPTQLSASATDANEGAGPGPGTIPCSQITWTSNLATDTQFPLTGCELTTVFATPGVRLIGAHAVDSFGGGDTVYASVTVLDPPVNYPPSVTVSALAPPNLSDGYGWDNEFTFSVTASDPEGNYPLTYAWEMTAYQPNTTYVPYMGVNTVIATTANLDWKASVDDPSFFPDQSVFGGACYSGQLVGLKLIVTDSLGNATTRVIADPFNSTLPIMKLYRCIVF